MKKLYKILIAVLIALSVCGNIYYFGYQELQKERQRYYNAGVQGAGVYIYEGVKKNGSITIKNGEEELTLIQK